MGRVQWPDGSFIRKDRDDTLVQAINRASKKTNIVKAELCHPEAEEDYQYVGVVREEDDASSEEQEDLGWTSGHIGDRYSLGVERNPRVSKENRRQIQDNPPSIAQGVKKLPEGRNTIGLGRQRPPISQSIHLNGNQPGAPKRITPIDVDQRKFEGEHDHQLLPMDVDQGVVEKLGTEARKGTTHPGRGEVLKVTNPRAKEGRNSSEMVREIMKMPFTVTLEEAVNMSPSLRRDLANASKVQRETLPPGPERREKNVYQSNLSQSLLQQQTRRRLGLPRDDLLRIAAKVGQAKVTAVFDSGSQVNVLSDQFVRRCGLPIMTEGSDRLKISGVNGGLARCTGIIPNAKIHLTESELETIGELVIVEDAGFDVLLGRPWATVNGAGLREAAEGTYLSFDSEGGRYEVLVSPNPHYQRPGQGFQAAVCIRHANAPEGEECARILVNQVSGTTVSDSEPNCDAPENATADRSLSKGWTPDDVQEEYERERVGTDTNEGTDEEERCWLDPPTKSHQDIERANSGRDTALIIETELQDSYIKMVQRGANEAEWDLFCQAERRNTKRNSETWEEWKDKREELDVPQEESTDEDIYPPDPPDASATLATPEPAQRPRNKLKKPRPKDASVITALRRSRRIKRESKRAKESEEWQSMKRKAYEREEKLTKRTVTSRNRAATESIMASFGAKLQIMGRTLENANPLKSANRRRKDAKFDSVPSEEEGSAEEDAGEIGSDKEDLDKAAQKASWPLAIVVSTFLCQNPYNSGQTRHKNGGNDK